MTFEAFVGVIAELVARFSAFVERYPITVVVVACLAIAAVIVGAEWWMVRRDREHERQHVDLRRREFRRTQGWDTSRRSLERVNGRDLRR